LIRFTCKQKQIERVLNMHMQIQEGIGYGQNSSLGFFEVAEIDNQIKGQLAGVVDKVVKNVTKEAKGTASQTAQNLKEEILRKLQPEIDKMRDGAIITVKKHIIEKLPTVRKLIEENGPAIAEKLIMLLDNKLREVVGMAMRKAQETVGLKNAQGAPAKPEEVEPFAVITNLVPNMEVSAQGLKLANPQKMAKLLLDKQLDEAIKKNVVIPMSDTVQKDLAPPLRKRAAIGVAGVFGLGALTALLGVGIYVYATSPSVPKTNNKKRR
jgi:hypothetical protein